MKSTKEQEGEGQGGMYNLLYTIVDLLDSIEKDTFTSKQLQEMSQIARQNILNNLKRLIKAGIIERQEYKSKEKKPGGRDVRYHLDEEMKLFIKKTLYK